MLSHEKCQTFPLLILKYSYIIMKVEAAMKNSFELIYDVVRKIPRGKVATYGQIAMLAGNPRWSRVVGYALHVNPDPAHIPCYRVVNRLGEPSRAFAFGFFISRYNVLI